MRAYQKKIVNARLRRQARQRVESRDGVVFGIDENNFYAEIKIQGSNELLRAHYPRNLFKRPKWLKVGNSCRVVHKGGEGGYLELTGPGRALPTPVAGGDVPTPPAVQEDAIVSGMTVKASSAGGDSVFLEAGYYKIGNVTYEFDPEANATIPEMAAASQMVMGQLVAGDYYTMGVAGGVSGYYEAQITTSPPSAGWFRYDAFVIGTDGVVDYLVGSNFTTTPVYPTIPADHILFGGKYILIIGGTSDPDISQSNIGQAWAERATSTFDTGYDLGEDTMAWSAVIDNPTKSVTISFNDQYGWSFSEERSIEIEMLIGTGQYGWNTAAFGTSKLQWTGTSTTLTFYYERNQLAAPEINPVFFIQEITGVGIAHTHDIVLLDNLGEPI